MFRTIFLFFCCSGIAFAGPFKISAVKYIDGLYRSQMPVTDQDYAAIKSTGIKRIICLLTDREQIATERTWAESNGIEFISLPISVSVMPVLGRSENAADLLQETSADRPTLLHCRENRHRTALVIALFRLRYQSDKFTPFKAYWEMLDWGFDSRNHYLNEIFMHAAQWDSINPFLRALGLCNRLFIGIGFESHP
jgi:protein tyrosine phosphatase (PTP) superfamily phosphohydrolase (DUF442 family)